MCILVSQPFICVTHTCTHAHTHTQELRAALQVFTDHATVCDHQVRASLLAELAAVCGASGHGGAGAVVGMSGEVRISAARLAVYSEHLPQHILQQGTVQYSELCDVLHYPFNILWRFTFFYLMIKIFFFCPCPDLSSLVTSTNPITAYLPSGRSDSSSLQSRRYACNVRCREIWKAS